MKNWTSYLTDDAPIRNIFGQEIPALCQVEIHEVCLLRDGPGVSLRFDLASYPDDPPKKWKAMGCNTVQLVVNAFGVEDLKIIGWKENAVVDLSFEASGDSVLLSGKGGGVEFYIITSFLCLGKISAYKNSE